MSDVRRVCYNGLEFLIRRRKNEVSEFYGASIRIKEGFLLRFSNNTLVNVDPVELKRGGKKMCNLCQCGIESAFTDGWVKQERSTFSNISDHCLRHPVRGPELAFLPEFLSFSPYSWELLM